MAGDGDLASRRLRQQVALASDHDFAFQLQVDEAIQASLRVPTPNRPSSSAATTAPCSCRLCQPAPALWSSEAAFAEIARQEKNRRDAHAFRAAHAQANTSARVASRGALLARELADGPTAETTSSDLWIQAAPLSSASSTRGCRTRRARGGGASRTPATRCSRWPCTIPGGR